MGTARTSPAWFTLGDPLRGVAAFGVLLFHIALYGPLGGPHPSRLGAAGHVLFNLDAGVFLFFVLSGFLIGRPFASAFVLQTPLPGLGRFLYKRARRLVPGMAAATLFGLLLLGAAGVTPARLLAVIGFAQMYVPSHFGDTVTVHFWTLDAEGAFYVALPLVALIGVRLLNRFPGLRRRALVWTLACALLTVASIEMRRRASATDESAQHMFPSVAFAFAPGLALAGLEPVIEPLLRAHPHLARGLTRTLLAAAAVALVAYFSSARQSVALHAVLATLGCALVVAAALVRAWMGAQPWSVLDNRPLQWLGRCSYSLYLFHIAVVLFLARHLLGDMGSPAERALLLSVTAIPLSLAMAWIGYALFERPFTRSGTAGPREAHALAEA